MESNGPKFLSSGSSDFDFDLEDPEDPVLNHIIYDSQGLVVPSSIPDHQPDENETNVPQIPLVQSYDALPFNSLTEARIIRDHIANPNNAFISIPIQFIGCIKNPTQTLITGYIHKPKFNK